MRFSALQNGRRIVSQKLLKCEWLPTSCTVPSFHQRIFVATKSDICCSFVWFDVFGNHSCYESSTWDWKTCGCAQGNPAIPWGLRVESSTCRYHNDVAAVMAQMFVSDRFSYLVGRPLRATKALYVPTPCSLLNSRRCVQDNA